MNSDKTSIPEKGSKDDSFVNESKEIKEVKKERKTFKKASFSEIVSFSKLTLIGTSLFVLAILATVSLGLARQELAGGKYAIALFGVTGLILFFGIVLDVLRWRDYSEWGALGAIIAYLGVFIMFLPLLIFPFIDLEFELLFIIELIGGIITIIGFTSHRTDLDDKIVNLFTILWYRVRNFEYVAFFSTLWQLIKTTVGGFFRYLGRGLKNLPARVKKFLSMVFGSIVNILETSLIVIGQTLKKSFYGVWNNLHWIGLIAVIAIIALIDLPIPDVDPVLIKLEILIIIAFFFFLGVIYPYKERIAKITTNTRNFVLQKTISAYSMLSGTKIKHNEAIFCSRCLRGVEKREFESLMEIKGMVDPPCPFCGFNSWVGIEGKPTYVGKLAQEEELAIEVKEPKTPTKDLDVATVSIIEEKAIKEGKFPDYKSYQRAQDVGVRTFSELEFIERLGAPDRETADKIKKGGFAHYITFQKALGVGASNVLEFHLVDDLHAPDLETAIRVQKSNFPDYPSYTRAQDLGAPNYSELKFIDQLQAPNYEIAQKMKRGKFPDYSSFKRGQDLGALNYSELQDLDRFQAPDIDTVMKIRKGRFPSFLAFQKAQEVGASSFSEYQLVQDLQAPNLEIAQKMKRGKFPDYSSYTRAQDLGASNYSELEEIDHYQAPDFEIVMKIRKGGFPDFQTYQKALEAGAFSFYEYQSIESSEFIESKPFDEISPPQKSIIIGKETSKLLEKMLEVSQRLANSNKQIYEWHRSLLGRITRYRQGKIDLGTFERMLRYSGESLLKINIEDMQPDEVLEYEEINTFLYDLLKTIHQQKERLLPEKERRRKIRKTPRRESKVAKRPSWDTTLKETVLEVQVTPEITDMESIISKLQEKVLKLNQTLKTPHHQEWNNWFFRQTDRYQNAEINAGRYEEMLKRYQKQYLLDFHELQVDEMRVLDEIRALIDAILTRYIKPITESPQEGVVVEKTVYELLKEVLKVNQTLVTADKEISEWRTWFVEQIDLYLNSNLSEGIFQSMLNRSQKFLQGFDTKKLQDDEKQALEKTLAFISSIIKKPKITKEKIPLTKVVERIDTLFANESIVSNEKRKRWEEHKKEYYRQRALHLDYGETSQRSFFSYLIKLREFLVTEIGTPSENLFELEDVDIDYAIEAKESLRKTKKSVPDSQTEPSAVIEELFPDEDKKTEDEKQTTTKDKIVLKDAKLDQEELKIINELKTLKHSYVGRINYLLNQLEKRHTLSPKTIEVVKNFRDHQDDAIRAMVKRIETRPAQQVIDDVTILKKVKIPLIKVIERFDTIFADKSIVTKEKHEKWEEYKKEYYRKRALHLDYGEISEESFYSYLKKLREVFIIEMGVSPEKLFELDITDNEILVPSEEDKERLGKRCPSCGKDIVPEKSRFCYHCGTKLDENAANIN
ncbi:MAG: hypothetical protein ACFFB5_08230 [Promethearchaeota archaeon]